MCFIDQEGSKVKFIDASRLLQPNDPWAVMAEPFSGSGAVGLAFGELYPDRDLVIGDDNHTVINAFQQVRDNLAETQEWTWRYSRYLESKKHARMLWTRWTESRDNPQAFCAPQRAALRFHAGPIGSLSALNEPWRKGGFSPARAGFCGSSRWVGSHAHAIEELAHWSAVLQRAEIRLSDYRETLTSVFDQGRQAFFFVDSPYRTARKGAASAAERYYGKPFDVDELGRQCQRISDAGHFAMVTLDWCDENAALFRTDWTVMKASWASYAGALSEHLVAINYTPLIPTNEVAAIKGWIITQLKTI